MCLPVPRDFRSLRSLLAFTPHVAPPDSPRLLLCAPSSASVFPAHRTAPPPQHITYP
ncbi:hypothetical protein HYPSUDRAFT_70627 [Hypholoma sublateritium FD-334 SS-4]|uniref:Uncharacterized protein n=1 Tax=Hypholoma sublateritium (strain FD-334 SS-4) TaxID=945553 RepID=A0A0D2KS65_HYPSF|nr:hypothetical protein HYPSUDRAFT_70627 [Hypholoma sublateritium FD-334 SS-4]